MILEWLRVKSKRERATKSLVKERNSDLELSQREKERLRVKSERERVAQ